MSDSCPDVCHSTNVLAMPGEGGGRSCLLFCERRRGVFTFKEGGDWLLLKSFVNGEGAAFQGNLPRVKRLSKIRRFTVFERGFLGGAEACALCSDQSRGAAFSSSHRATFPLAGDSSANRAGATAWAAQPAVPRRSRLCFPSPFTTAWGKPKWGRGRLLHAH